MQMYAIVNNEQADEHEQRAFGARATSMPACIDQARVFKNMK